MYALRIGATRKQNIWGTSAFRCDGEHVRSAAGPGTLYLIETAAHSGAESRPVYCSFFRHDSSKEIDVQNSKKGNEFVKRVATVGAVWAVAKALETPLLARKTRKIDRSINTKMNKAGKNLRHHAGLMLAGIAALAVAAGLLGRASMK